MRTTVTIEDTLYDQALELADPDMDKAELFREAIVQDRLFQSDFDRLLLQRAQPPKLPGSDSGES